MGKKSLTTMKLSECHFSDTCVDWADSTKIYLFDRQPTTFFEQTETDWT